MKIWKICGLFILQKNEKACSKENTKDAAGLSLSKGFMGLYEQKHCQFE